MFTNVNLKLISDIEKYQFVKGTITGIVSMICKGYAEATNKFLKFYNINKPTPYIIYLGMKHLIGLIQKIWI